MRLDLLPEDLRAKYLVHEWRNACAVLHTAHPAEWTDVLDCLRAFTFCKSELLAGGGSKSVIASRIDAFLAQRGWVEKQFQTAITVDQETIKTPTHKVDCLKGRVALEIEWNNKDPFFDRDLNNFRLLFDLRAIDVGVIITRASELQDVFKGLGRQVAQKYGASTTHWNKLVPKIEGGGAGGCPILIFGITDRAYIVDDAPMVQGSEGDDEA